tara:strand:- start:313 stop:822 length:510 start_codon:yes stop_codon:yes gene_type:complete
MLEIFNTLQPFFEDNYKRIGIREYARLKKISPPNASQRLKNLRKEGLLQREDERNYILFSANRENKTFIKLQQTYYTQKFENLIKDLEKELTSPTIILFGSLAKAELSQRSDIDLAIFSSTKKKVNLKKFEKKFGREIQVFQFKNRRELNNNKELLNSILNGTILSGGW